MKAESAPGSEGWWKSLFLSPDVTGSQISTSARFLEQGFDSLSLTQVAFAIRKEFGVRVSFSQLMKELPSIDMLAAHLAEVRFARTFRRATRPGAACPSCPSSGPGKPKRRCAADALAAESRTMLDAWRAFSNNRQGAAARNPALRGTERV